MIRLLKTIDAHAGGQVLRLVVEGVPRPHGKTAAQQRAWLRRHHDATRLTLLRPPRGHIDVTAAILTEPTSPDAHAGILFMDAAGYPSMSGHGVISAATIAIERDLFFSRESTDELVGIVFDTPAGTVRCDARLAVHGGSRRVDRVAMAGPPSFVHTASQIVTVGARRIRVDVAYGGAFFAIVDSEATGIPLTGMRLPDLRRLGVEICASLDAAALPVHPLNTDLSGISGVVFTGPPQDPEAHLRNVMVSSAGAVDVSPCATGTAAVMAVLDAMGLLPVDHSFVHEGLSGALLRGRIRQRTQVGDLPAILTEIDGSAWIIGEHTFCVDDEDPLREGMEV
jgi:proline racemase